MHKRWDYPYKKVCEPESPLVLTGGGIDSLGSGPGLLLGSLLGLALLLLVC